MPIDAVTHVRDAVRTFNKDVSELENNELTQHDYLAILTNAWS